MWVYLLGIVQVAIAITLIANLYRKPAAWIAVAFSVVNLVVSFAALAKPENPILGNPAPIGIKLIPVRKSNRRLDELGERGRGKGEREAQQLFALEPPIVG
ncbi:MAG: hypothetical protein ACFB4I_05980 [Cyanophyceae cyanobacterium]